jgi:hypothetical protein
LFKNKLTHFFQKMYRNKSNFRDRVQVDEVDGCEGAIPWPLWSSFDAGPGKAGHKFDSAGQVSSQVVLPIR